MEKSYLFDWIILKAPELAKNKIYICICMCACVRACVRACGRACGRACVRACVRVVYKKFLFD